MKLFAEVKVVAEAKEEVVFDLEEALEYFERIHDLRFMEEEEREPIEEESQEQLFPKAKAAFMRIFSKKAILDELVDFYNTDPEDDDEEDEDSEW